MAQEFEFEENQNNYGVLEYQHAHTLKRYKIRSECNPQEVYVYEYNNHECCIDWDGDLNAIRIIATVWGEDVARTIKRKNACYPIDSIFK